MMDYGNIFKLNFTKFLMPHKKVVKPLTYEEQRMVDLNPIYWTHPSIACRVYAHSNGGAPVSPMTLVRTWRNQSLPIPVHGGDKRIPRKILEDVCTRSNGDDDKAIGLLGTTPEKFNRLCVKYGLVDAPQKDEKTSRLRTGYSLPSHRLAFGRGGNGYKKPPRS
jgi:hypothetical protein